MLDVVVQAEEVGIKKTMIQDGLKEEEEDGVVSCCRDGELLLPLFSDSLFSLVINCLVSSFCLVLSSLSNPLVFPMTKVNTGLQVSQNVLWFKDIERQRGRELRAFV